MSIGFVLSFPNERWIFQEAFHEIPEANRELPHRWGLLLVSVIDHRIFASDEPRANVEQNLVPVRLQEELGKAKHTLAGRGPLATLESNHPLLLRGEFLQGSNS